LLTSPYGLCVAGFAQNEKPVTCLYRMDRLIIYTAMVAGMRGFIRLIYYVFRFIRHGLLQISSAW
jgi:hypothetical protein